MGNYERTLNAIDYYEERIEELKNALHTGNYDAEDEEGITMELLDLQQSVGECRGYLEELAEMDGYPSYEDMLYEEMLHEDMLYDSED